MVERRVVIAMVTAWLLTASVINPSGEFPLNDDWAYALPVRELVHQHVLRLTDWQSMPLVAQLLWGSTFSMIGGFSFTTLRLSTLTLGSLGSITFFFLLRRVEVPRAIAIWTALSLMLSPIHVALSNTFMTDVPFLALSLLGAFCFLRALATEQVSCIAAGVVATIVATLIRQLGVALAMSYSLVMLARHGFTRRWLLRGLLPSVLVIAAWTGWNVFLEATGEVPSEYQRKSRALLSAAHVILHGHFGVLENALYRSLELFVYAGLFGLPWLVMGLPSIVASLSRKRALGRSLVGIAAAVAVTVLLGIRDRMLPATGNVLLDFGVGPRTLPGPAWPGLPAHFWWIVTFAGALGSVALALPIFRLIVNATRAARAAQLPESMEVPIYLLLLVVITFAPISISFEPTFDRYFLFYCPFLWTIVLLGWPKELRPKPWATALGATLAILLTCFSVGATHDYLAWNRARWQAGEFLLSLAGITSEDIDGGFEWNHFQQLDRAGSWRLGDLTTTKDQARYAITFNLGSDDELLARYPVRPWLPMGVTQVLAVRHGPRDDATERTIWRAPVGSSQATRRGSVGRTEP